MPLILAIEPDKRQASQLTAMVRGRLNAELVLADSADRALSALGDRVPDLVLTSALLSPRDESTLSDRLRALDGHAAHVQTLTIPVLATHSSHGGGRASGVLAALRREKSKSAGHAGCDPAVFAEQCKEYLERAAVERAVSLERAAAAPAVKEPVRPVSPSPVTGSEWVVVREEEPPEPAQTTSVGAVDDEPAIADQQPIADEVVSLSAEAGADVTVPPPEVVVVPEPADSTEAPRVDRVLREFLDFPATDSQGPASLLAAVAALEAEEQNYLIAPPPEPVPAPVPEALTAGSDPAETGASVVVDAVAEMELRDEPPFDEPVAFAQAPSQVNEFRSLGVDSSSADRASNDGQEIDRDRVSDELEISAPAPGNVGERTPVALSELGEILRNAPEFAAPQPAKNEAPRSIPPSPEDLKEWVEIVEALRRDAEQLDARRATPTVDNVMTEEPAAEHITEAAPEKHDGASSMASAAVSDNGAAEPVRPKAKAAEPVSAIAAAPESAVRDDAVSDAAVQEAAPVPDLPPKRKRRRTKNTPAQDEWGFFDPDQCGFAALIEKLEEITEKDEKPTPRGA